MPNNTENVNIVTFPKDPASLKHSFETEEPCPVSITFEDKPANVIITTAAEKPIGVDMDMNVRVRETIPVCIKICEPICARSDYNIGITVFDRPTASVGIRGETRIFNCREQPKPLRTCLNFADLKPATSITAPFAVSGLTFSPMGAPLRLGYLGQPSGQLKLEFPVDGVRIDWSEPADNVQITLNSYAGGNLDITAYSGEAIAEHLVFPISNQVKEASLSPSGITRVEIKGGNNESSIIQVCYEPRTARNYTAAKSITNR